MVQQDTVSALAGYIKDIPAGNPIEIARYLAGVGYEVPVTKADLMKLPSLRPPKKDKKRKDSDKNPVIAEKVYPYLTAKGIIEKGKYGKVHYVWGKPPEPVKPAYEKPVAAEPRYKPSEKAVSYVMLGKAAREIAEKKHPEKQKPDSREEITRLVSALMGKEETLSSEEEHPCIDIPFGSSLGPSATSRFLESFRSTARTGTHSERSTAYRQPQKDVDDIGFKEALNEVAYEFFDPNPKIFRGIVEKESRTETIDHPDERGRTYKRLKPSVNVLSPDGNVRWGLVSPTFSQAFEFATERWKELSHVAGDMKQGDIVLLRSNNGFQAKSGKFVYTFEPLVSIRESDNLTRKDRKIVTHVDGKYIFCLPILGTTYEHDRMIEKNVEYGVAFLDGNDMNPPTDDVLKMLIDGAEGAAKSMAWQIAEQVEILPRSGFYRYDTYWQKVLPTVKKRENQKRTFIICELPLSPEERAKKVEGELSGIDKAIAQKGSSTSCSFYFREPASYATLYVKTLGLYRGVNSNQDLAAEINKRKDRLRRLMLGEVVKEKVGSKEYRAVSDVYRDKASFDSLLKGLESKTSPSPREQQLAKDMHYYGRGYPFTDSVFCTGFFNDDFVFQVEFMEGRCSPERKEIFNQFLTAVKSAKEILAKKLEASYDWKGKISESELSETANKVIDENAILQALGTAFKGIDVKQTLGDIIDEMKITGEYFYSYKDKLDVSFMLTQPYLQQIKEQASRP